MSDARYKNSKIYKIVNNENDKVYYGSTCLPLYKRMYKHRQKHNVCMSKNLGVDLKECQIILVEEIQCENKQQLLMRERWYIENNVCINKQIPCRTKEDIKEKNKKRYEKNREHNKEREKKYYEENKEKVKKYYEENKTELIKKQINYYENNKEKLAIQHKELYKKKSIEKIVCECGKTVTKHTKKSHDKSITHIKLINDSS